jgi:hypothetical protein
MDSKLELIKNLKLKKILKIENYLQIVFYNDYFLFIYNEFEVSDDFEDFEGLKVVAIEEKKQMIKLFFEKRKYIFIDMRPEAYNCPEALQLNTPDEKIFVWS